MLLTDTERKIALGIIKRAQARAQLLKYADLNVLPKDEKDYDRLLKLLAVLAALSTAAGTVYGYRSHKTDIPSQIKQGSFLKKLAMELYPKDKKGKKRLLALLLLLSAVGGGAAGLKFIGPKLKDITSLRDFAAKTERSAGRPNPKATPPHLAEEGRRRDVAEQSVKDLLGLLPSLDSLKGAGKSLADWIRKSREQNEIDRRMATGDITDDTGLPVLF